MKTELLDLPDEAISFIFSCIRRFSRTLETLEDTPLPEVQVVNIRGEQKTVIVFGGEEEPHHDPEDHVITGRDLLVKLNNRPDVVKTAALTYDAYLTLAGEKTSAIIAEILNQGKSHTFAQRYRRTDDDKIELLGKLSYIAATGSH